MLPAPLWLQNLLQVVYHVLSLLFSSFFSAAFVQHTKDFCPLLFSHVAAARFSPVFFFLLSIFFLFSLHFCVHLQDFFPYFCRGAARFAMCVCVWMLGVCFMPLKCNQASRLPLRPNACVCCSTRGRLASAAYKYNATCALCSLQFISSHQGHHGSSPAPAPAPASASAPASALVESFVSCERSV